MDTMTSKILSIANLLSFLRLLLVPVLIVLAVDGESYWFLGVLAASFFPTRWCFENLNLA